MAGIALLSWHCSSAQQVPDTGFDHRSEAPTYASGEGPVVFLDEAHRNYHTLGGRYVAFGRVLSSDGYIVRSSSDPFTPKALAACSIMVIANALSPDGSWDLPTESAFTEDEIATVEAWVRDGGSLFLIADHMPFGGAVAQLARAFGFNWINGVALPDDGAQELFVRADGSLQQSVVTDGIAPAERIDSLAVFTGSAFLPPSEAIPITRFVRPYTIFLPQQAGRFDDATAHIDGRHFVNGAMLQHGRGRLVCFAEAAMFSAQLQGPDREPMGMNQPVAKQNPKFLLNLIHWLDHRF